MSSGFAFIFMFFFLLLILGQVYLSYSSPHDLCESHLFSSYPFPLRFVNKISTGAWIRIIYICYPRIYLCTFNDYGLSPSEKVHSLTEGSIYFSNFVNGHKERYTIPCPTYQLKKFGILDPWEEKKRYDANESRINRKNLQKGQKYEHIELILVKGVGGLQTKTV